MDELAELVAQIPTTTVTGVWMRHSAGRWASSALDGRIGDGRWGTAGGFEVLYLGDTLDSVVVEAYRHLVDPILDPTGRAAVAAGIHGRVLVRAQVEVTEVVDLRGAGPRWTLGLSPDVLGCDTDDVAAYGKCQAVSQVAHQLGRHGILVPAATGLGLTLALFPQRLPPGERPQRIGDDVTWIGLPADPRAPKHPQLRPVPHSS